MHGVTVYVKKGLPFAQDLSLENSTDSYVFDWLYFTQCLTSFSSINHLLCLCAQILILFHLTQMRSLNQPIWKSIPSLETFTSIIRTDLPILMELIDLVNSVIIFLSQMTLFIWLTFVLGSQNVILIVLLFCIYFFLLTLVLDLKMAFAPLGNSHHVVVSVYIDFSTYLQHDAPFHRIAYALSSC